VRATRGGDHRREGGKRRWRCSDAAMMTWRRRSMIKTGGREAATKEVTTGSGDAAW
jgi:hypothetical protein